MRDIDRLEARPEYLRPWQSVAACLTEDSTWFFPPAAEQRRSKIRREARAKAICARCPVMQLCRDHALRVEEPWGIWGALTEDERAELLLQEGSSQARSSC